VGGEHLEAAIGRLNVGGGVAGGGQISLYHTAEPTAGPRNMALIVSKRLTLRGFLVGDHSARMGDFLAEVTGWVRDGKLTLPETIVDGIENAPAPFPGLFAGQNTGKMIVRLGT